MLNSVKDLRVTNMVKEFWRGLGWATIKNEFPETIIHKIFEVNYRKSLISVFKEFFPGINKSFILAGRLGTRLSFEET